MEVYMFVSSKLCFHLNFLIFLLLLSGTENSRIITRCREKERQALIMFKEGLKDEFGHLSSWQTDDDCCKWEKVQCSNRTSHVIGLHLQHLGGKLTPSLLELEYLTYLDLSFFNGSISVIPEFIGSLKGLKYLNLSSGTFVGEIPVQLWNLSNLQYLDLRTNAYKGGSLSVKNLNGLSHLSSLRYLDLSGVNLSMAHHDWTQAIDTLASLQELKLSGCVLPGITLTKFSPSSFNLSRSIISVLDLSYNNFGIELSRFHWLLNHSTTLTRIDLSRCGLIGGIPHDFGKMQSLEYLDVSRSTLEGELTNSIGNVSTLKLLDLSSNKFNGTIPPCLLKLPKLETLRMAKNLFQGELPEFLQSSPLIELDLRYNKLSGCLPQSIGNLTELKLMYFSSNGFTGSVTEVLLQNLSKLTELALYHNSLSFEINSDWVPPFNLTHLDLVNCEIGPHFPSWLKTQPYLSVMSLAGCGIDDVLPYWFGHNFPELYYLDLSSNQIHGNLPYWSSDFGVLEIIDLSSNKFQNSVSSICNLSTAYLFYLDLSNNLFLGKVPSCLMQLNSLAYLNLGNNKFSGKLPTSISLLTQIESLHLQHNSLDGVLPTSLQQCKLLRVIDFGHNKFRGQIPRWLGTNLQNLVILGVGSNQFEGSIPSTLCHLRKLQILDLSNNNIYGKLPNCLGNLASMVRKERSSIRMDSFRIGHQGKGFFGLPETASLMWKGILLEYSNNLDFVKIIDLSNNRLSGEIPSEITYLEGVLALNISGNNLHGNIPQEIGHLKQLEFLDLSRNQLSGVIPLSLSELHFIGFLNLSTNNLSGRIPLSTQLQSFGSSSYSGNPGLCGLPLPKPCLEDRRNLPPRSNGYPHQVEEDEEEWFKSSSFYTATGIGFAVGLCATLGLLLFNRSCRVTYFRLVSNIQDSLYVAVVLKIAKLKRLLKN